MQQLDIFVDSAPVQRANELIVALSRFDRAASRQALLLLTSLDPVHAGLSQFQLLCDFVESWPSCTNAPSWPRTQTAIAEAAAMIRERINPAAAMMGSAGISLVRQSCSDLARESAAAGIGPEHPDCFAAELYLRAQQWADVVRSAEGIPGAPMRKRVQRWLGLGYHGCGKTESARCAVFRYAWLAPDRFIAFIEEMQDSSLSRDWRDFQSDLDDLDATWFPAWCAHEKKAGATILDNLPSGNGPRAYQLVTGLAIRERSGLSAEVYEDRAKLKRLGESFFSFYLERRSDIHHKQR
jgi:hypothetical protein